MRNFSTAPITLNTAPRFSHMQLHRYHNPALATAVTDLVFCVLRNANLSDEHARSWMEWIYTQVKSRPEQSAMLLIGRNFSLATSSDGGFSGQVAVRTWTTDQEGVVNLKPHDANWRKRFSADLTGCLQRLYAPSQRDTLGEYAWFVADRKARHQYNEEPVFRRVVDLPERAMEFHLNRTLAGVDMDNEDSHLVIAYTEGSVHIYRSYESESEGQVYIWAMDPK